MRTLTILTLCAIMMVIAASPIDANFREIHAQYFTDAQLDNLVRRDVTCYFSA